MKIEQVLLFTLLVALIFVATIVLLYLKLFLRFQINQTIIRSRLFNQSNKILKINQQQPHH